MSGALKVRFIIFMLIILCGALLIWSHCAFCLAPRSIPAGEIKLIAEIGPYPGLQALVFGNKKIKEALITDPVLRPVFIVALPDDALGDIHLVKANEEILKRYGGEELLQGFSGFFVGSPQIAQEMLNKGYRIMVGVTDRVADYVKRQKDGTYKGGTFNFEVANGRQCYFPLADGTWLGVKGIGQFSEAEENPFYWNKHLNKWFGVAREEDTEKLDYSADILEDKMPFIRTLGYRRISKICNGTGGFQDLDKEHLIDKDNKILNPVLIFNHALTPHRLNKFAQLIQSDPNLTNLIERISEVLVKNKRLAQGFSSPVEYMTYLIEVLARSEAAKVKKARIKKTIHSQDFSLAGEESDLEELISLKEYLLTRAIPHFWNSRLMLKNEDMATRVPYDYALYNIYQRLDEVKEKEFEGIEDLDIDEILVLLEDGGFYTKLNLIHQILEYGRGQNIAFLSEPALIREYLRTYFKTFFQEMSGSEKVLDMASRFGKFFKGERSLRRFASLLTPRYKERAERDKAVTEVAELLKREIRSMAFPNVPLAMDQNLDEVSPDKMLIKTAA